MKTFAEALMGAEADAICGAPDGCTARSGPAGATATASVPGTLGRARSNWRSRGLRSGSYFPDRLLERQRRTEAALVSVVATCYLLGVSTRRMHPLVHTLGITQLADAAPEDAGQ